MLQMGRFIADVSPAGRQVFVGHENKIAEYTLCIHLPGTGEWLRAEGRHTCKRVDVTPGWTASSVAMDTQPPSQSRSRHARRRCGVWRADVEVDGLVRGCFLLIPK